jgi:hypothetical protein
MRVGFKLVFFLLFFLIEDPSDYKDLIHIINASSACS